jgi:RNA polymerase sigma factor (TIGR02999 family)
VSDSSTNFDALLEAAAAGDPEVASQLLPLVYDHLRELARRKLATESPGQTLQPTALVHEAYMRLVSSPQTSWNGRKHFFAAAALAMRRILVERARAKRGPKRGGDRVRFSLETVEPAGDVPVDELDWVALDGALDALQAHDADLADVVHLRYFAGLGVEEIGQALGRSERSIQRDWNIARAWLLRRMEETSAE